MKDLIDRKELLQRIEADGDVNNNVQIIMQMPKANKPLTFCDIIRLEKMYQIWLTGNKANDEFKTIIKFLQYMEVF